MNEFLIRRVLTRLDLNLRLELVRREEGELISSQIFISFSFVRHTEFCLMSTVNFRVRFTL